MSEKHTIISKDQMPFLPSKFKETKLGWPKKSIKQYRYGRVHVHEYNDRFETHVDKINPETDPLGHIIHDAPEVLAVVGAGAAAAITSGFITYKKTGSKLAAIITGISTGVAAAYATKKVCDQFKDE